MPRPKQLFPTPRLVLWRNVFHISWTDNASGTTRRRSLETVDKREAERKLPSVWTALLAERSAPTISYTMGEIIRAYDQQRGPKRDSTFYALRPLTTFFSAFTPAQLRNDSVWRQYRAWRTAQSNTNAALKDTGKPVSDATAVKELNVFRAIIAYGRRNGWSDLTDVKVHIPDSHFAPCHEYLARGDAQKLLNACEPHQRLFVRLALATGARMSAILQLTWDSVTWPSGSHEPTDADLRWIEPAKPRPGPPDDVDFDLVMHRAIRIDLGQGRGNKRRGTGVISETNMGLYHDLAEAYQRRKSDHVIEWHGKPLRTIDLSKAYKRAGLEGYARQVHLLKHTCCSWLVQSGASYEAVGKLVGTRANVIEAVYGHLSPKHLATVGAVLSLD